MTPYIITEDLSSYQHLDGHIIMPLGSGINTSKPDINNKELTKHDEVLTMNIHMMKFLLP